MGTVYIHPNALKHGLSREQIFTAYETALHGAIIRSKDANSHPPRWGAIGFDAELREIELVFVRDLQRVLIFHANYATNGFKKEMRK